VSRSWIIIFIIICLFSFTLFPIQEVEAYTTTPANGIRMDRTDFPTLYLSTPQLEGDAIWLLQARLRDLGYGLEPNGKYDPYTSEIVKLFQVANNMKAN
jgi:peptidoglycan hydrolase-like protein with peptidoglycan-binding domain